MFSFDVDYAQILYSLIILVLFSSFIISKNFRIRDALTWIFIIFILVSGYAYKSDLSGVYYKIKASIIPGEYYIDKYNNVKIYKRNDGHFYVNALLKNRKINFLVDTGASLVVLTINDAKKLGIEVDKLNFNQPAITANGLAYNASILIDEIKIGNIIVQKIYGSVAKNLDTSLLGMSFMNRLSSFTIINHEMILKQ